MGQKRKSVSKAQDRYPIEWVAVFYEWQMRKSQIHTILLLQPGVCPKFRKIALEQNDICFRFACPLYSGEFLHSHVFGLIFPRVTMTTATLATVVAPAPIPLRTFLAVCACLFRHASQYLCL